MFRGAVKYLLLCACVAVCSCVRPLTEAMVDIDPLGWEVSKPARITILNEDTVGLRTISLLIRYTDRMQQCNIPLSVEVTSPDGRRYADELTATVLIGNEKTRDFHETEIPYRTGVLLNKEGGYAISIATQIDAVEGISAVGVRIKQEDGKE